MKYRILISDDRLAYYRAPFTTIEEVVRDLPTPPVVVVDWISVLGQRRDGWRVVLVQQVAE